nr:hypothetical protein B0A51_00954 [Rachicladosporium sp. CCFEE 5018]
MSSSSEPLCAQCNLPLVLTLTPDSEDEEPTSSDTNTLPDDVHLPCGHHFHWSCLLEAYETTSCPACHTDISSPPPASSSSSQQADPQILVTLHNEGGLQQNLDIFPLLREEAYLRAFPEQRKCLAFLEFCAEGDQHAIVTLLQAPPEEGDPTPGQILRSTHPFSHPPGQTGLHIAVSNGHREVAFLLLLLASEVPELDFPALVYQEAAAMGIMREEQAGLPDIRGMLDEGGRSAEDVARSMEARGPGVWHGWAGKHWLSMPQR